MQEQHQLDPLRAAAGCVCVCERSHMRRVKSTLPQDTSAVIWGQVAVSQLLSFKPRGLLGSIQNKVILVVSQRKLGEIN